MADQPNTIKIGSTVRVKENAYEGSSDPKDFKVRGKAGEVVANLGDAWEVRVGDEWLILKNDELEEVEFEEEVHPDTPQTREMVANIRHGIEMYGWDKFEEMLIEALDIALVKEEHGKRFYERADGLKISIGKFED